MKIAIVNDSHWGVRNDADIFIDHFSKFYREVFFPELEKRGIKTVFHLGDLMDRRKFVNFKTLAKVREEYFDHIARLGIDHHIIIGNHDTFYKNTNDLNSLVQLFNLENTTTIYEDPTEIEIGGRVFAMIPWINSSNKANITEFLQSTNASVVCGHFEINGFEMVRGFMCDHGMAQKDFSSFDLVLSGHFHRKGSHRNIHYLGTQYQITFGDHGDTKGFHILDTETLEMEFVENPHQMFHKFYYHDGNNDYAKNPPDFSVYKDTFVKMVVLHKSNPYLFDKIVATIETHEPYDLTITDSTEGNIGELSEDETVDLSTDTLTLIHDEVKAYEDRLDPKKLRGYITDLYAEALQIEN